MWQVPGGRRHRSWRRPPLNSAGPRRQGGSTPRSMAPNPCDLPYRLPRRKKVDVAVRYLGANDDDAEVGLHFFK
jgi:hypothetical protein